MSCSFNNTDAKTRVSDNKTEEEDRKKKTKKVDKLIPIDMSY